MDAGRGNNGSSIQEDAWDYLKNSVVDVSANSLSPAADLRSHGRRSESACRRACCRKGSVLAGKPFVPAGLDGVCARAAAAVIRVGTGEEPPAARSNRG